MFKVLYGIISKISSTLWNVLSQMDINKTN
jgi:hypothetical protein